jgi:hypothetical protein
MPKKFRDFKEKPATYRWTLFAARSGSGAVGVFTSFQAISNFVF